MDYKDLEIKELMELIGFKRSELNKMAEKEGLHKAPSDELLQKSMELDYLLNLYQKKIQSKN